METEKMRTIQLYVTEELHGLLKKTFGDGKMSANVERILRAHLQDSIQERKLRFMELTKAVKRFNADFSESAELIMPEPEPSAREKEREAMP